MKHFVTDAVQATLAALHQQGVLKTSAPRAVGFSVDPPKNAAHGDFACNVAMVLAKVEGQPPRKLAEAIVAGLVDVHGAIDKVDIAGPGFLNFTLSARAVTGVVRTVLAAGETWGRSPSSGKRVLVEYVPRRRATTSSASSTSTTGASRSRPSAARSTSATASCSASR